MAQVNALFNKVANKGRSTLTEVEGYDVFTLCGIKTPAYSLFTNGNDAADFVSRNLASNPSRRFVAKVVSPDVIMICVFHIDHSQDRCGRCNTESEGS